MAQLNTIPAESAPLTAAPQSKTKLKGLVAGAAVAAFVLGMLAATAVTSQASRAPANLSAVDRQCRSSRSCNPKHNDEAWPHYNPDCSGNGKCSTCRKHTTSFNGNSWKGFCMDPDDEKK